MRGALAALAVGFGCAWCAGCGDPAPPAAAPPALVRLIDPDFRASARLEPGSLVSATDGDGELVATIAASTRPVLFAHERIQIAYLRPATAREDGRIVVDLPIDEAPLDAVAFLLEPTIVDPSNGRWILQPPQIGHVTSVDGRRVVRIDTTVPSEFDTRDVQLSVRATRYVESLSTSYEVSGVRVAAGGSLELALGVLGATPKSRPLEFSVEACRDDHCVSLIAEPAWGFGWIDRSIALDALEPGVYSMRFTTRSAQGGTSLPVWGDPVVVHPDPIGIERPNVILVSLDTLRRDHLDVYGYERRTAPALARLFANAGTVMENLHAEATTTAPSHMTLFTSLPASVHGVSGLVQQPAISIRTLAQELREVGYRTAAFNENGPLAGARGFALGFDRYDENKSDNLINPAGHVERTFAEATRWIQRHRDQAFFLFVHTFQVHAPFDPPAKYYGHFGGSGRAKAEVDRYDQEIRYVDDQLARLAAAVANQKLGDRTIWVVLSDHGEAFHEHGRRGHGGIPYEEVLRVPLMLRGPGIAAGRRSNAAVHHLDVMPTVLELVGLPPPPGAMGRSFADLLRPDLPGKWDSERPRFSTSWSLPKDVEAPALAVRVGQRKLIRYRKAGTLSVEYYDLAKDPSERVDLSLDRPDEVAELAALLDDYEQESARIREQAASGAGGGGEVQLDPARAAKLRALGYLE